MPALGYTEEQRMEGINNVISSDLKEISIVFKSLDDNKLVTDTFFVTSKALDKISEILKSDAWNGSRHDLMYLDGKA